MRGIRIFLLLSLLTVLGCGDPPAVLDTTDDKTTRVSLDAMLQVMTPEEGREFGLAVEKLMIQAHGKEKVEAWDGIPTAEMMKPIEKKTADEILDQASSL